MKFIKVGIFLLILSFAFAYKMNSVREISFAWAFLTSSTEMIKAKVIDIDFPKSNQTSVDAQGTQVIIKFKINAEHAETYYSYIRSRHDQDLERDWYYAEVPGQKNEYARIVDGTATPLGALSLTPLLGVLLSLGFFFGGIRAHLKK